MSYILEAIRRSEEQRLKRLIPAVSTIQAPPPAPARAGARTVQAALGMGLALALVAAAGLALRPWLRQAQEAARPAPAAATAPLVAAQEKPDLVPAETAATAPATPQLHAVETAPPQAPAAPAAASAPAAEPAAEAKRPRRPYSSGTPTDPPKSRRELGAPAGQAAGSLTAGGEADPPEAFPQPRAGELVTATALRDLPLSVQRTLPNIAITLHRYAPSTEARMIRVNGRVAREGDGIGGELSVAEITRNGVVFAIAGQRFYMDAFQTWPARNGT